MMPVSQQLIGRLIYYLLSDWVVNLAVWEIPPYPGR